MNKLINQGFTLIELVIVIALTAIVMTVGATIFSAGANSYITAERVNKLSIEAAQAIELMAKELRSAQIIIDIHHPASTHCTTNNNRCLEFRDKNNNHIIYYANGSNLQRQYNSSTAHMLSNALSSLRFHYYPADLSETNTASSAKLITIELTLSNNGNTISLIRTIYLRNLL